MTTNPLPSEAVERVARAFIAPLGYPAGCDWERIWVGNIADDESNGSLKHLCLSLACAALSTLPDAASEREKALEAALREARDDTHLVAMLNPAHQADDRLTGNRIREAGDRLARIDAALSTTPTMSAEDMREAAANDKLAVSQEAREAMEAFVRDDAPLGMKMMFGGDPAWKLAQAFARVIAQARAAGERAGMEKAAGIAESHDAWPQEGADIASAIRAASTGKIG